MVMAADTRSGASRWERPWAALLLAATLAAVLLALHARWVRGEGGFALTGLPGFDAYVYAAMAEQPRVFTVAPWGYRILSPTLAHALSPGHALRALRWTTDASLFAAALLVSAFVRRLGGSARATLLAVAAFCLSPPVADALRSPFTGDGLGVAIESGVLLCVAANAGLPLLLLLLAVGLMAKDVLLILVPLTYVPLRRSLGRSAATAAAAALTVMAVVLMQALRWWWTPQIHTPHPIVDGALFAAFVEGARGAGLAALRDALLLGLTPLAALGAVCLAARPFLRRYGYLVGATLIAPFLAWANVPAERVFGFFGDVPRLHIYALPLLIPLALWAIDRVWPMTAPPAQPTVRRQVPAVVAVALLAAAGLAALYPFAAADRYRRYPLHERREGLQVFLACRMSLRAAEQLAAGRSVALVSHVEPSEPADSPARRRWCLMQGWDDAAVFGTAEPIVRPRASTLILPTYEPRPLALTALVRSATAATLAAGINGQALPAVAVVPGSSTAEWQVPANALFRGDNVLTLEVSGAGAVVLDSLRVRASDAAR